MAELQAELQRLSGTTLDAQGSANVWAGLDRPNWLDLVGALNTRAGIARADWLDLEGVLNRLAGTTGLGVNAAAAAIAGHYGLVLPGTAGNYVSTPDSVLNSITGDIDIRVLAKMTDWTALSQALVGKFGASGQRSYVLRMASGTAGRLELVWSQDGSAGLTATSSSSVAFAAASVGWVRATLDVDNGSGQNVTTFYTSSDGMTWTALGSAVTKTGVTNIFDGTKTLEIGSDTNGTTGLTNGTIYYAEVRSGIDGPVVAKFDASAVVSTGTRLPATVDTVFRNNGDQTDTTTAWTINGSAWSWEGASFNGKPQMALDLPGTAGNYASTPDTAGNSVTGDIDIRAKVTMDDWTPTGSAALVAKALGAGDQRSYRFGVTATGLLSLNLSQAGTTETAAVSTVATGSTDGTTRWVRATWRNSDDQVQFFTSDDGSTWIQLGANASIAVTGIFDSTAGLEIGARNGGATEPLAGLVHYAEVRNGINGPIVARFDPSAVARTAARLPATLTQPGGSPNLLTPNQASIETDATGWAAGTGTPTLARSTAQFLDGAASLRLTATAVGPAAMGAETTAITVAPVTAGKLYTAGCSFRAAATGQLCKVGIHWYTSASASISTSFGTAITDTTAGWTAATVTALAPATAAYGTAQVEVAGALATEVHYVDRVSLVEAPAVWTINGAAWDWVEAS